MEQVQERKMTIARGLTRIKTIQAQLATIVNNIEQYGAWVDKEKHPLGDTKLVNDQAGLKRNHEQARQKLSSMWQQYEDLNSEWVKIQTAINRANDVTSITIGGKSMTVAEAKVIEDKIIGNPRKVNRTGVFIGQNMVRAYQSAVANAEKAVRAYNQQYNNVKDETVKAPLLADVLYLVDTGKANEYAAFINEFLVEFNATLNEVNAVTDITL